MAWGERVGRGGVGTWTGTHTHTHGGSGRGTPAALGAQLTPDGGTLVLGGPGLPARRVGGAQGEGEGGPDVLRVPQLV